MTLVLTIYAEHTLLVTEEGVEVLTARLPDSPGGAVPMPKIDGAKQEATTSASSTSKEG
jgi:hypothetical protein